MHLQTQRRRSETAATGKCVGASGAGPGRTRPVAEAALGRRRPFGPTRVGGTGTLACAAQPGVAVPRSQRGQVPGAFLFTGQMRERQVLSAHQFCEENNLSGMMREVLANVKNSLKSGIAETLNRVCARQLLGVQSVDDAAG